MEGSAVQLDTVSYQLASLETRARDEETETIVSWFNKLSFSSKQADTLSGVQPGTGTWFLTHGTVLDWIKGDTSVLWCPGIRKTPLNDLNFRMP